LRAASARATPGTGDAAATSGAGVQGVQGTKHRCGLARVPAAQCLVIDLDDVTGLQFPFEVLQRSE
jgi:hypothetical protein